MSSTAEWTRVTYRNRGQTVDVLEYCPACWEKSDLRDLCDSAPIAGETYQRFTPRAGTPCSECEKEA